MTFSPAHHLRVLLVAAALLLGAARSLDAQGTAPVPLDDPAYVYLDRLEELGVADSAVMGQRPYSYREMGRLVRAARLSWATRPADAAERSMEDELLTRLEARVIETPAPTAALLDEARVAGNANNAVRQRPSAAGSNTSPQALIDPLALRRLGDPAVRGTSVNLELLQRAEPTPWLAINGRERLDLRWPSDVVVPTRAASVLAGGGRVRWGNVALMAGREQLGWGSGGSGGLFIAADAPALDQVSLASDQPVVLPGFLRRLGPVGGTLFVADLGPSALRSHSKMLAYKLSARPTASLELGATFQDHYGGEGGRPSARSSLLIDFLPFFDIFRKHNYYDTTRTLDVDSDKALGIDMRWHVRQLGGLVVAGEWLIDDFDAHRLVSLFNWAGSHTLTATLPRLVSPAWSFRVTATHMGPLTYTHAALRQGMTVRERLLGNELGPDTKAFGAELRWAPTPVLRLSAEGRSAIYSSSTYSAFYDAQGLWVVRKVSSGTDELREMAIGSIAMEPTPAVGVTLRAGVGRTRNVRFEGGRRHSYVGDVGFRWRP